jgi:hypothetical protein
MPQQRNNIVSKDVRISIGSVKVTIVSKRASRREEPRLNGRVFDALDYPGLQLRCVLLGEQHDVGRIPMDRDAVRSGKTISTKAR